MLLLPIKMKTLYSTVGFAVLLIFPKPYESLSYETGHGQTSYRNINDHGELSDVFGDEGLIQIEVAGKYYVTSGSQIFVQGSYDDSDAQLETLPKINVQINNSSNESPDRADRLGSLTGVYVLSLENLQLFNMTSETFKQFSGTNIKFFNMQNSDIKKVAADTLVPVQEILSVLDLSNATISEEDLVALMQGLRNDTLERTSHLSILTLSNIGLNSIPYNALRPVQYSLLRLSLYGNNFGTHLENVINIRTAVLDYEEDDHTGDDYVSRGSGTDYFSNLSKNSNVLSEPTWANFPVMPFLLDLDLRNCKIDHIIEGAFRNLENLQQLRISKNNILLLQNFAFEGLTNLKVLDISFNNPWSEIAEVSGVTLRKNSFAYLHSLTTMNLSNTAIRTVGSTLLNGIPPSLTRLDLSGTHLTTLADGTFVKLNKLQTLNLSNNFGLGTGLTRATFSGLIMLRELSMTGIALQSLEALQELSLLRKLDVKKNSLNSFEGVLKNFPVLEHLDVSCNFINSWKTERAFASNSKLQSVYLHSNILSLMSQYMLEDFKSLSSLTLANNDFVCNCVLNDFMEYLMAIRNDSTQTLPILIDYESEGTVYDCTDASLSQTVKLTDTANYCVANIVQYWLSTLQHCIYIFMLLVTCCFSIGGVIYWKWWYIRYFAIFIKNATVYSMINVENCEDRIYIYDVFLSYSDQNRNWVIQELIPNIEGPETHFNICLHERDFQVGVGILENIILGMDQSRTILLIISGCFLNSQWCQFEMHLAQHRLLETCREELVLVLLEEIPRKRRSKILHYLMTVKTYIVWPKDSEDIEAKSLFWKRLRRAITTNKAKHTSVM